MKDMQDKILAALEAAALGLPGRDENGLDVRDQRAWSNTGSLFVQDGWQTVIKVGYAFQSDYCSLTFHARPERIAAGRAAAEVRCQVRENGTQAELYVPYDNGAQIEAMLTMFAASLAWAPAQAPSEGISQ